MQRFFLPPECIEQVRVRVTGDTAYQIRTVLRFRPGERFTVLDNAGSEYIVELERYDGNIAWAIIRAKKKIESECALKLHLFQAILKGENFEIALQKCTEIGVCAFTPVLTRRVVAKTDQETGNRITRWQRVIKEAAEQSARGFLPVLNQPVELKEACRRVKGVSFILWEKESRYMIGNMLESYIAPGIASQLNLFIGPEGGFEESEVEFARSQGITPVSLGRRLLRSETSALVASSIVFYHYGDLGR